MKHTVTVKRVSLYSRNIEIGEISDSRNKMAIRIKLENTIKQWLAIKRYIQPMENAAVDWPTFLNVFFVDYSHNSP